MRLVVVTRHPAMVDYLREIGLIADDVEVISHASADAIRGCHVIGFLPLFLAAEAAKVTVIPLVIPKELRGVELSLDQVRGFAQAPQSFEVRLLDG